MYGANGSETFRWFMDVWNVDAMNAWIKEQREKRPGWTPEQIDPRKWASMMNNMIIIDTDYAMSDKCSETEPGIVIEYVPGSYMIVDGWHRLYKAHQQGKTEYPMWLLFWDEQVHFLIDKEMVTRAKGMAKDALKELESDRKKEEAEARMKAAVEEAFAKGLRKQEGAE
jgi:hypothetical protein